MKHREGIIRYSKEYYEVLMAKLKEDIIFPLTFLSNALEWFCARRILLASTTANRMRAALIRMKTNNLE